MAHPEPPSHDHGNSHNKRKRDPDDGGSQKSHDRIPQPPPPQSGNGAHINYLSRANSSRLQLIQGDAEVFSDVLSLIGDYEGVLSRHESLAANLGAKLTGPRLVRAMEGLFEGPITVSHRDPYNSSQISWLDIVQFAKASPAEFNLTTTERGRVCAFYLKGSHVEITEDDWRLIMSGALDRFNLAPPQPLDEDENSELATLEILEQRLHILIKRADEVARKARQLNYHLSGRKSAISSRRTSSPPSHHVGFQPVNHPQQPPLSRPASTYDLHADLLQQFTAASSSLARPGSARVAQNSVSLPSTPVIQQVSSTNPAGKPSLGPIYISGRPSPASGPEPQQVTSQPEDPSAAHRPLITARIEKLAKGETIYPPCDRCRRLRVSCIKHLTACQGCTKKHAKCAWKAVTDEEITWLKGEAGSGDGEGDGDDGASRSGGGYTPDPQSASSASVAETRTFAPTINHSSGPVNGASSSGGGGGSVDTRPKERQVTEFGLREQHQPRVDHYRLSQMASVALNSDTREQQQQRHSQSMVSRGASTPRE